MPTSDIRATDVNRRSNVLFFGSDYSLFRGKCQVVNAIMRAFLTHRSGMKMCRIRMSENALRN